MYLSKTLYEEGNILKVIKRIEYFFWNHQAVNKDTEEKKIKISGVSETNISNTQDAMEIILEKQDCDAKTE